MSTNIIHLYRSILKRAKEFPSKNRLGIIREIKVTFRENKSLTNDKLTSAIEVAQQGLVQLSMYANLKHTKGDWNINLSQQPMPPPSDRTIRKVK